MDVTVISKGGIGTANAVIQGALTEANAASYCLDQPSAVSCKSEYLKTTKLEPAIYANCTTGTFTTFFGDRLQFLGRNVLGGSLNEFIVQNLNDGSILDGTSASGLSAAVEQLKALCPNIFATESNKREMADSRSEGLETFQVNPASPKATKVTARGVSYVPGAIICPDYATVMLLFRLYNANAEQRMQDNVTRGQSALLRGKAAQAPDPSVYGCLLVEAGAVLFQDLGTMVPLVTAQLKDGSFFKGVTMAPMVAK